MPFFGFSVPAGNRKTEGPHRIRRLWASCKCPESENYQIPECRADFGRSEIRGEVVYLSRFHFPANRESRMSNQNSQENGSCGNIPALLKEVDHAAA